MKIRNGFVSNSSSSSFVVKVGKPFNTALELANHMIPFREWDCDQELVNKVNKLIQKCPETPAVCFKSCNYDTFIAKMGDVFLVQTCHNHDWDLSQYSAPCPSEYYNYFGDDSFYNLEHSMDFLHLDYDVIGRPAHWRETKNFEYECPKCHHWGHHWIIGEDIKCPRCGSPPALRKKNPHSTLN